MSFVGPRPEAPDLIRFYNPKQLKVLLSVKPGLTDIASITFINEEKKSIIIIYAEGCKLGPLNKISKKIKNAIPGSNVRYSILGHIQRGGTAVPADRILGTILGNKSVEKLLDGRKNEMIGIINKKETLTSFEEIIKNKRGIDKELYNISKTISNY